MGSNRKGAARAAKQRRRAEAETRNALTPEDRRRTSREGSIEYRLSNLPLWPTPQEPPVRPQPVIITASRHRASAAAQPARSDHDPGPAITLPPREKQHKHRPARHQPPPPRAPHVAARRIGDGIKPNHVARALSIETLTRQMVRPEPCPEDPPTVTPPANTADHERDEPQ